MRLIGQLQDETHVKRFSALLYGEGIENRVEQGPGGDWEVWVLDEGGIDSAKSLFSQFSQRPDDPAFIKAAHAAAGKKERDQKEQVAKRSRLIDGRTIFYKPPVPLGVLSITLIAISVGATLLTNLGQNDRLIRPFSITQYREEGDYIVWDTGLPEVRHGQVWRLFTPMFLHFGVLHLLFNMLWLRDLGSMVEARKGSWMLLLLVLVIAAVSNVGQYLVSGPMFGGMSGVVYGLLGYVWMQGRFNRTSNLSLQKQTVTLMIVWFFVCLSGLVGPIANTAHAIGAGLGIAWGYVAARLSTMMRRR
jgi:GlpG protein